MSSLLTGRTVAIIGAGVAAYVMPSFASEGVDSGLLDALHLADCLISTTFESPPATIHAYEGQTCAYAHQAQKETAAAETNIHSDKELLRERATR